jgi:hypothetical protein
MRQFAYVATFFALCACEGASPAGGPEPRAPEVDTGVPQIPVSPEQPESARLVPTTVESVDDLPGRYVRPFALPGQVSTLTLGAIDNGAGAYELHRSCGVPNCLGEQGTYHAVPENPAVGFAFFSLQPAGSTSVPETYIIDLLWRSAGGDVVALQVRRLYANDAIGLPQVFWRLPDAPATPRLLEDETADGGSAPAVTPGAADAPGELYPELPGIYVRALPVPGDIGALTLGAATWQNGGATGTYQASYPYCLPWCIPESGTYHLEIASAITGTGRLEIERSGEDTGGATYVVLAIWRDLQGHITALQLQRVWGPGLVGAPFVMYRQWWTAASGSGPADDAGETGACAYYQALAQYFHIRALQCAYSVCYPLSPVYGYWAQYYDQLAQTTCGS